jgi:hypothetical protein
MLLTIILALTLLQAGSDARPTIIAHPSDPPRRNYWVIYYDDTFLFAARHFGNVRDFGGATAPGLFVHSKEQSRWIQITAVSTVDGSFGKSTSNDAEAMKKLSKAQVMWDFTPYAERPYIEQPLLTGSSIAFPERITYDAALSRYELRYFSSWGVPSAETVLYVDRGDLIAAFARH